MKFLAVSDNHGFPEPLRNLKAQYPDMDGYLHLGDACVEEKDLEGWIVVSGNNDPYFYDQLPWPFTRILEVEGHRILMEHGHRDHVYMDHYEGLVNHAEREQCDIVLFGHTHLYLDTVRSSIRLLNPGSLTMPRDSRKGTYMTLEITQKEVKVQKHFYEEGRGEFDSSFFERLESVLERKEGQG